MTSGAPTTLNYFTAPPARRARFVAWVVCATSLLVLSAAWLFRLRVGILNNDALLIGGWAAIGSVVAVIMLLLKTTPSDSVRLSSLTSKCLIVGGAALLHFLAVTQLLPALSDDLLRYRLDGRMWLSGVSPYATTPNEYLALLVKRHAAATERLHYVPPDLFDGIDAKVRFRYLSTIYPAVAQVVFTLTRWLEDRIAPPPDTYTAEVVAEWRPLLTRLPHTRQGLVLRAVIGIVSVAAVGLVISILRCLQRSPWYAVLLAWNPLFVIETGGMGHVDVVGVLFVLLTIRALQSRRPILATAMLALAAGVKPHVVLLAPFLLRDAIAAGARVQLKWLAVAFVSFLALVYSPMLYQQGYRGWLKTSHVYATSWEANGSIYDLIKSTADETDGVAVQRAKDRARMLASAAVVVTMLIAWFGRANLATAGYWVFLVALLFSPVVYPWYLLWVLCFVPLLRGWQGMTALVWAATVGVSYLLWRTSDWVLPTRWLLVEYVPVYATLMLEVVWLVRNRLEQGGLRPTVSAQLS